ncbi:MAG TPA: L,D-transpeptidase [Solirubrobacterales bacterium]|nr:L,D-transpeptidase [Solirubrobacterales bacterium]
MADRKVSSSLCAVAVLVATLLIGPGAAAASHSCRAGGPAGPPIGGPGERSAWRAAPVGVVPVYRGIPGTGGERIGAADPAAADWLLVLRTLATAGGRCWVKVRLPGRPNRRAGWASARRLLVRPTPWRLVASLPSRTLDVYRGGHLLRMLHAVVGAPDTPTPPGIFSIVHVWRADPDSFVGSWVLGLTAHSDVLRHFEGGSGEVGIHGRGGASLSDPLGSAASHGCIRLANRAIDWLVRTIGRDGLPGIPVRVS